MSDPIKHECGIALIRLKKNLQYYGEKYGTCLYGLNKMYLLMEKQHNRGQDGAGLATIKLNQAPGKKYISRYRSAEPQPIKDIFHRINSKFSAIAESDPSLLRNGQWLSDNISFTGELLLGHLRYGTYGKNSLASTHPFLRQSNWMTRNLVLAGNFNLTNVDEIFQQLVDLGQFPKERSDSVTMLEKIGHFIDQENRRILAKYGDEHTEPRDAYARVAREMEIERILKDSTKKWDGGYVVAGMIGHGDAFVLRDPNGIRPAFYFEDEEVIVLTSERPQIQTAFDVPLEQIQELPPGSAMIIKRSGATNIEQIIEPGPKRACSFERIYFSRGSDRDIYRERKQLGALLVPQILDAVDHDLANTVFSFVPNTAESCFFGLNQGVQDHLNTLKVEQIQALGNNPDADKLAQIVSFQPRVEKVAIKDTKVRTFISQDDGRDDIVSHVYDITYGTVTPGTDYLVVIDDSIVRGTTLRQSIIRALDRLGPRKIVVVSSAPQIRYPDCYGIDMAKLGDFIAFQAAIALLTERGMARVIEEVYQEARRMLTLPREQIENVVQRIYAPFTEDELSAKISALLTPVSVRADVSIIFQTLDNLHTALPDHQGDWYFSGNYPTPGGNRVVCQSFINYVERRDTRAY